MEMSCRLSVTLEISESVGEDRELSTNQSVFCGESYRVFCPEPHSVRSANFVLNV